MSKPVERRLMTSDEQLAVEQMKCVTFPCGCWDKRFYRDCLSGQSSISEKAAAQLWRLFIRYRRQMTFPDKRRLLELAEKLSAPDFRKLAKMEREQAEINAMKAKYGETMNATIAKSATVQNPADSTVRQKCDLCGREWPISEIKFTGSRFLCHMCRFGWCDPVRED